MHDGQVILEWDNTIDNTYIDIFTGTNTLKGYRIYKTQDPTSWTLLDSIVAGEYGEGGIYQWSDTDVTNDPNDNATRFSVAIEYGYREKFFLRSGYKIDYEEQGLSAGAGFELDTGSLQPTLDYAYTAFGIFGDIHHFSLSVGF